MAEGWIRSVDRDRGIGLIAPADGGADVIVRDTDLRSPDQRGLEVGEWVSYTVAVDADGTAYAAEVTPLARRTTQRRPAEGMPAARSRPPAARTAVVFVGVAAVLVVGAVVATVAMMVGGGAIPGWWPYVFGGIIAVTLVVGRLVGR
ncbi:cold-shock protein [Micromonospora sp. HM5-17]|jgi:cold shock CspA family protein|uniref:cold-shock protein n=1 Tax=Micromonospora sp. HM5-17 TaxID=2487710 RepID=UPI000F46322C|nr:cold shock domain-containing protein [Micromonospora sp. HM5-17]ROT31368.1 hypothetical protein EF879_17485 [Micromonospora sp. HM5-17]